MIESRTGSRNGLSKGKTNRKTGSNTVLPKKITMDDILPLLPHFNNEEDKSVNDYVLRNAKFIVQHKLTRINQAIDAIREKWSNATPLEIWVGYDLVNCCSDDLLLELDKPGFKQHVKDELYKKLHPQEAAATLNEHEDDENEDDDEKEDETDDEYIMTFVPQPKKVKYHRRFSKNTPADPSTIPPTPKGVSDAEWRSWSDIHRKSYLCGMKDPNAFLYRNCPPGVQRKTGPWSEEEKKMFLKRLKEIRGNKDTIDGKWGIFSLGVPGRVGYQCSNFYRLLISNGELHDSRYIIGDDGKLHHTSHLHPERASKPSRPAAPPPPKKKKSKPVQRLSPKAVQSLIFHFVGKEKGKAHEVEEGEFPPILSRYERWALQNPLPDVIDQITGEIIKVPTISPDGYVLDYNTWINSLKTKNENPFTRKHVTKRDLVVLTLDNIDSYRDSIINL